MFETATYDGPLVLDPAIRARWACLEASSAAAVLRSVYPTEWADISFILGSFRLDPSRWLVAGGNRGDVAKQIDGMFSERGWREIRIELSKLEILKDEWARTTRWN